MVSGLISVSIIVFLDQFPNVLIFCKRVCDGGSLYDGTSRVSRLKMCACSQFHSTAENHIHFIPFLLQVAES